jgi:hypothetical protein
MNVIGASTFSEGSDNDFGCLAMTPTLCLERNPQAKKSYLTTSKVVTVVKAQKIIIEPKILNYYIGPIID